MKTQKKSSTNFGAVRRDFFFDLKQIIRKFPDVFSNLSAFVRKFSGDVEKLSNLPKVLNFEKKNFRLSFGICERTLKNFRIFRITFVPGYVKMSHIG